MRYFLQDFMEKGDKVLLGLCVLASSFGLLLIYTSTRWMETYRETGIYREVTVQFFAILIGIVLYILLSVIDFQRFVEKFWQWILCFNIVFLLLLLTPLGTTNDSGNLNWLDIPGLPVDIQPNEIVKVSFILLMAHIIARIHSKDKNINHISSLTVICGHALFTIALVALICGDWGMCVVYASIVLVTLWAAGLSIFWFITFFTVVLVPTYIAWTYYLPYSSAWDTDYRILRFRVVLDRTISQDFMGYHQIRSMLAIGSGRFFGQGYLHGTQTQSLYSHSLPARHTDFIFSVCGEELGFMGCTFLLLILAAIVLRCIWISQQVDSYFSTYVAMGIAGMMLAQIILNVGMCLFVLPVMGLTLPFVSYGGSSIITFFVAMGIVSSLRSGNLPSWIRDRSQLG
ncbi:MAG: FtsW/RodA/SpoVE family cell cycle protein [Eubacteriales bacterium]